MNIGLLTSIHTALSLIALILAPPAMLSLFGNFVPAGWPEFFIVIAIATSVTGFLFPYHGFTPAFVTGIVALAVLAALLLARYRFAYAGVWRKVYAIGMVASFYLLAFVAIAQAFMKIPPLHDLAPTLSEPPFAVMQMLVLVAFVLVGRAAVKNFQPGKR